MLQVRMTPELVAALARHEARQSSDSNNREMWDRNRIPLSKSLSTRTPAGHDQSVGARGRIRPSLTDSDIHL